MTRAAVLAVLGSLLLLVSLAPLAAAAAGPVSIAHTPPTALPGQQIDLQAVLTNATSAVVLWNNGSMAQAASVPMTNLSQPKGGGWAYEAWLPAQADGTQVKYSITATGPGGTKTMSYVLTVSVPPPTGMTPANVNAWLVTMAAVFSMAASMVVAIYYYIGLRLRREEI